MVAAAAIGAATIGAGASMAASSKAAKATKKASEKASDIALTTADSNNALQREIYGQNKATLAPFVGQGTAANDALSAVLGLPVPTSFETYVRQNPDLLNDWQANYADGNSPYADIAAYGRYHYDSYGQREGRQLPANSAYSGITQGASALRDQMSGAGSASALINQNLGINGGAGRVNPYTAQVDTVINQGVQSKAGSAITALLGLGGDRAAANDAFGQYRNATGYDFRQAEGQKGLTASLGAQGMLNSGSAVKSALRLNQNLASGEFGNYIGQLGGLYSSDVGQYGTKLSALSGQQSFNEGQYNNLMTGLYGQQGYNAGQYQDFLNHLTQQQGVGLSAAGAQAGVATGYANASNQNSSNAANVAANAALASGNASAGAALNAGNAINSALSSGVGAYALSDYGKSALGSSYNPNDAGRFLAQSLRG